MKTKVKFAASLLVYGLMLAAVVASATVNAFYWGAASVVLMVVFGACDLLKPVFFAAGTRTGVIAALACSVLSIWAAGQFFSGAIAPDLVRLDIIEARIAEMTPSETAPTAEAKATPTAAAADLAEATADQRRADSAIIEARRRLTMAQADEAEALRRRDGRDACDNGKYQPDSSNPRCQSNTEAHLTAKAATASALAALSRSEEDQRNAAQAVAAATVRAEIEAKDRSASAEEARKDRAAAKKDLANFRAEALRIRSENGSLLATAEEWGLTPTGLVLWLSRIGSTVVELVVTAGPAILISYVGIPTFGGRRADTANPPAPIGADGQPKKTRRQKTADARAAKAKARKKEAGDKALAAVISGALTTHAAAKKHGVSESTLRGRVKRFQEQHAGSDKVKSLFSSK